MNNIIEDDYIKKKTQKVVKAIFKKEYLFLNNSEKIIIRLNPDKEEIEVLTRVIKNDLNTFYKIGYKAENESSYIDTLIRVKGFENILANCIHCDNYPLFEKLKDKYSYPITIDLAREAIKERKTDIFLNLLEQGIDIHAQNGELLYTALDYQNREIQCLLIERGASIKMIEASGKLDKVNKADLVWLKDYKNKVDMHQSLEHELSVKDNLKKLKL